MGCGGGGLSRAGTGAGATSAHARARATNAPLGAGREGGMARLLSNDGAVWFDAGWRRRRAGYHRLAEGARRVRQAARRPVGLRQNTRPRRTVSKTSLTSIVVSLAPRSRQPSG